MVTRKAAQMGHVLPRRTPTGEVLSVASADSDEFGALTEILARTGTQLVAYLVVAFIVLSTSVELGVLLLIAAPVLVGAAFPLLRPLHRRQQIERGRNSDLTSMATDIVAGLRILRGIGGERTFGRNYAAQSQLARQAGVSPPASGRRRIEAVGVLFSGRLHRAAGLARHPPGDQRRPDDRPADQLPRLRAVHDLPDPDLLRARPEGHPGDGLGAQGDRDLRAAAAVARPGPRARRCPSTATWYDELTGFVARDGELTIVVCAVPEDTVRARRPAGPLPPGRHRAGQPGARRGHQGPRGPARPGASGWPSAPGSRPSTRSCASREWGVTARRRRPRRGLARRRTPADPGQRHRQPAVRRHPPGRHRPARPADPRARPRRPLRVANAEDVYDALPGGWQGQLDERGRGLSGGQRQRVVLARALAADAPDPRAGRAHLRGRRPHRGADRRAGGRRPPRADDRGHAPSRRCGCTTPTGSCSSQDGRAIAEGTHEDLLLDSPATAASSPARWTRRHATRWTDRWPAQLLTHGGRWTTVSDLLATSADTWRDRAARRAGRSRRSWSRRTAGSVTRPASGAAPPARPARAAGAGELRRSRATPSGAGRWPTTARCWRSSAPCCASAGGVFVVLVVLNALAAGDRSRRAPPARLADQPDRRRATPRRRLNSLALLIVGGGLHPGRC